MKNLRYNSCNSVDGTLPPKSRGNCPHINKGYLGVEILIFNMQKQFLLIRVFLKFFVLFIELEKIVYYTPKC